MSNSPNLQLPYLDANQNQKTVTHNAALTALDALVNCQVQSAALTTPPSSPGDGQCWIVGSAATGAWAGKDLNIAAWQDGAWSFYPPTKGMLAYNDAGGALVVWNGTAWSPIGSLLALLGITALGIGTSPDTGNPLSATLNAALFNALVTGSGGTGDVRVKLNKQAIGNTASFLFQDGFAGRAEIGLCGDDSFHFKVSADGATWTDAISIAAVDGSVSLAGAINRSSGDVGHSFAQRAAITNIPVPTFQPSANTTTNGGTIALDIMPKGTPSPVYGDTVAWIDICNADCAAGTSTPTNTLHLAARTSYTEIGSNALYGATAVPLVISYGGAEKARVNTGGFNIGAATNNANALLQINGNTAAPATTTLNGKVGLELVGPDATNCRHLITTYGGAGYIDFTRYDGTQAAPTALAAVDTIGQIEWNGYNGSAIAKTKASIVAAAAEAWTTSANGTYMSLYTTPAGSTAVAEVARFTGAGLNQCAIGATTPAAATFTSLNGSCLAGHRNRLINSSFRVNQRAFASGGSLAAGVYGVDRWKGGASGSTVTITAGAPDNIFNVTAGSILQVIEATNIEGGGYVLSWAGSAMARVYQTGTAPSYAASPIITTGLTANTAVNVEFTGGTFSVAQFEAGTTPTPFERRLIGTDIFLCERYYRTVSLAGILGIVPTGGTLGIFTSVFERMRTAPSITLLLTSLSAAAYDILAGGTTWVSASSMALGSPSSSSSTISTQISGFSGLTAGQMLLGNNAYSLLGLSAEL